MNQENILSDDLRTSVYHYLGEPTIGVELNKDQLNSLYVIAIETFELYSNFAEKSFVEDKIKQPWINAYFRALCMGTLSTIRGKFNKVNIPDGELQLNYQHLFENSMMEMERLRNLFMNWD